jgi:hypothetical protein
MGERARVPAHNLTVTALDGRKPEVAPGQAWGEAPCDTSADRYAQILGAPLLPPGSEEEERRFQELRSRLPQLWMNLMGAGHVEQTVVVVPSLSLDIEQLSKLKGAEHYEERLLFLLILLSLPKTRVVYVSSLPIHPSIVEYYLQLLPGVPFSHARQRLHMFSCYDTSLKPLTAKILERPTLLRRLRNTIRDAENAHLTVFNVTHLEKQLSVALDVPLLGMDPKHLHYGSKSGARALFKEVGVPLPDGCENLKDEADVARAVVEVYRRDRSLKRVVIKLNEGFSGEGNAVYSLAPLHEAEARGKRSEAELRRVVLKTLPTHTVFELPELTWISFREKLQKMQGVVEAFIEGEGKESPSVQVRLTPLGEVQIISTHDQILGGPSGQVFLGCSFPARADYRQLLHEVAAAVGKKLAEVGVIERFSIDCLAVPREGRWDIYAVEINLRKGGTTHPFRTLQFLTGGRYNPDTGLFETSSGEPKYYMASDNLVSENYKGLSPEDLIDIITYTGLHYNSSTNTGVVFHMIGALSQYGKTGVTCVGNSPQEAEELYQRTLRTLDQESRTARWMV